jgi:hypothetical protein
MPSAGGPGNLGQRPAGIEPRRVVTQRDGERRDPAVVVRQRYGVIGCGVQFFSETLNPGEPS